MSQTKSDKVGTNQIFMIGVEKVPIINEISIIQIRLATLALLFISVVAFHITMPKEDIIFIPAREGPIKIIL